MAKNSKKVKKYYVVERGRHKGFFDNWDACKEEVHGYRGSRFCSFEDLEEAVVYASFGVCNGGGYIIDHGGSRKYYKTFEEYIEELDKIEMSS